MPHPYREQDPNMLLRKPVKRKKARDKFEVKFTTEYDSSRAKAILVVFVFGLLVAMVGGVTFNLAVILAGCVFYSIGFLASIVELLKISFEIYREPQQSVGKALDFLLAPLVLGGITVLAPLSWILSWFDL